jgi:hypothetical protein
MRAVSFVIYFKTAVLGCRTDRVHRKHVRGSFEGESVNRSQMDVKRKTCDN